MRSFAILMSSVYVILGCHHQWLQNQLMEWFQQHRQRTDPLRSEYLPP